MRFWDASALVPTFLDEVSTKQVRSWQASDPGVTIWMMTVIEVMSAVARKQRERPELAELCKQAIFDVRDAAVTWVQIEDAAAARHHAERIIMNYPLRAADALQLAAALVAADGEPQSLELVTLDGRLAEAARREGFPVLGV
ncbi:PIN domain-containing protein [Candidatus Binatus sp.]|uniref:PIN domain-containing protein n=1 Tax=Candidatus Binatus sp. TaxID=2811406 RepID=UPI003CC5B842